MGLPEHIVCRRSSPGFRGVYDEDIIGPYDIGDLILVGLQLGYSDEEITRVIRPYARKLRKTGRLRRTGSHDIDYVRFIRELVRPNTQKR